MPLNGSNSHNGSTMRMVWVLFGSSPPLLRAVMFDLILHDRVPDTPRSSHEYCHHSSALFFVLVYVHSTFVCQSRGTVSATARRDRASSIASTWSSFLGYTKWRRSTCAASSRGCLLLLLLFQTRLRTHARKCSLFVP